MFAVAVIPTGAFAEDPAPDRSPPDAGDIQSVFAAEVSEFGTPLVPGMSSIAMRFPLKFMPGRPDASAFMLNWWYLTATWYLFFDPFVEMGLQLSYVDYRRGSSYVSASAGVAVEYFDLGFAMPVVLGAEWSRALGRTGLWAGAEGQVLIWSDGVGVELALPLQFHPRVRLYGAVAPQAIVYFVDSLIHFNVRTALTVGIRGRGQQ